MNELQIVVGSLMTLLLEGGPEAAGELIKETAVAGAHSLAGVWREIFSKRPQAFPLADKFVHDPDDSVTQQTLRQIVTDVLRDNPELLQQAGVVIHGDVRAEKGSVAVGTMSNSTITIENKE